MPGVHSDLGGGYENPDKDFDNIEKIVLGIHSGLADGGHTQRTAIPQLEAQYARSGRTVIAVPQLNGDIHVQERRRTRKEHSIFDLGMAQEPSGKRSVFYNNPSSAEVPMTAGVAHAQ